MGYQTMGRLAIGNRALGFSSGFDVNVGNDEPGPQRMRAWSPVEGIEVAWGDMVRRMRCNALARHGICLGMPGVRCCLSPLGISKRSGSPGMASQQIASGCCAVV